MISIRSILLVLLVWILLWLGQRWYQRFIKNQKDNKPTPRQPTTLTHHGVMVRCDYCGLHLPQEEAISSDNAHYCCEAHKRAAQQP